MARPIKQGLDYFPLDVNCDDKLDLIEAKYGIEGFGIVVKLWQKIYKNGYYLEWNKEMLLLFKKQINVDIKIIENLIKDCLNWKIFDKNLYNKFSILTSNGIQTRYFNAIDKRKKNGIIEKYLLLNIELIQNKQELIPNKQQLISEKPMVSAEFSTQSKVKESKVNKSKVNEIKLNKKKHTFRRVSGVCFFQILNLKN